MKTFLIIISLTFIAGKSDIGNTIEIKGWCNQTEECAKQGNGFEFHCVFSIFGPPRPPWQCIPWVIGTQPLCKYEYCYCCKIWDHETLPPPPPPQPTTTTTTTTTNTTLPPHPEQNCTDNGCEEFFDGHGKCFNLTNLGKDWARLDKVVDLQTPSKPGLCLPEFNMHNHACCACLRKWDCVDNGCSNQYPGQWLCLNTTDPSFAQHSKKVDFSVGGIDNLCKSQIKDENCCTCFKTKVKGCCPQKTVGGVRYELVDEDENLARALGCIDDCFYQRVHLPPFHPFPPPPKVCFKFGDLPSSC